jgi:predicted 2-oxoglutarate/Fe(II)-dependent dioxygenase YbiX
MESADGDAAAVQPAVGAPLEVVDEIRRAWEVDLPDTLHDTLVLRLEAIRAALSAHFEIALQPCDAVAALRYPPGAFYRTHRDTSAGPDPHGLHRRAVSIVIFVNSGRPAPSASFAGGALRLHDLSAASAAVCDITPVAGTLVAFRASQLHEVRPVTSGTRLSVATWLLGPDEPEAAAHHGLPSGARGQ